MLIVSQDKTMIINLNNVESINVCNDSMRESPRIRVFFSKNSFIDIARYKTKEKAIEELETIKTAYDAGLKLYNIPKE